MNLSTFENLIDGAVFEALDIGEIYGNIQIVVRDPDNYAGILKIASVTYRNGFLYIETE